MIVGLGHYRRTGKNTFAKYLAEALSPFCKATQASFAYKLKQICHDLYGWAGLREPEYYETEPGGSLREVALPAIGKSPRQIWIDFGNAIRKDVYPATWLDYVLKNVDAARVTIITDVRFPNEAEAIKLDGGLLVKITRPGFEPGLDPADQALVGYTGWDSIIEASNMAELRNASRNFAREILVCLNLLDA